jgi:excisionase family DNA binding protein
MVLRSSDVRARRASSRVVTVVEPAIKEGQPVRLVANGKTVTLPASFAAALYQTAREQAVGHRVTVSFPDSVDELTPNQVAAELGISRPLLVKLLDDGTIPSRQLPGSRHRKVARVDLDAYQEKKSTRRRLVADAMNQVATSEEYLPR